MHKKSPSSSSEQELTLKQRMTLAELKSYLGINLDGSDIEAIQMSLDKECDEEDLKNAKDIAEVLSLFRQIEVIDASQSNEKLIPLVRDISKGILVNGGNGQNPEVVQRNLKSLTTGFKDKYHMLSDAARAVVQSHLPVLEVDRLLKE